MRRIARDLTKLQRSPPEGIGIEVGEQDILDLRGWIQGPGGWELALVLCVTFQY